MITQDSIAKLYNGDGMLVQQETTHAGYYSTPLADGTSIYGRRRAVAG